MLGQAFCRTRDAAQIGSHRKSWGQEVIDGLAKGRVGLALGGLGNDSPILLLADRKILQREQSLMQGFILALRAAQQLSEEHPEESTALWWLKKAGLSLESTRRVM